MSNHSQDGPECPILNFKINDHNFTTGKQFITGAELKKIGKVDGSLFLSSADSWEDVLIEDTATVDLARPGIEYFYSGEKRIKYVEISINHRSHKISGGDHKVSEIKKLGNVPEEYELEQVIDGKFIPLPNDGHVHINGCEVFIGHVCAGKSS